MAVVGIDLGTTNSLAAAFINGESILIPNTHGELLTPSVISLSGDGEIIIGKAAKDRLISAPSLTTSLFKRQMGTDAKIKLGRKTFLPEELSSFILRQLISDAENYLGEKVTEAVISVPAYFNANQRAATKLAGSLSGVKVERLVNEPSAAALACRVWDKDETFIIIDFGGGTLDVSIVEAFDNVINVCSISGNNMLGGIDFDHAIAADICTANNIDLHTLPNNEYQALLKAAETAKIQLAEADEATVSPLLQGQTIGYTLTSNNLFHLSKNIFEGIKKPIQQAVQDSGLAISDIDKCILVGGSCRMPIVQEFLDSVMRVPVTYSQDTDMVVAMGLGTYVGIKQRIGQVKDLVLTDICPFSLNIGSHNYANPSKLINSVMIPRNTALPVSRTSQFFNVEIGQTKIGFPINQGEAIYADDNTKLGALDVTVPHNKKENEAVDVTFTYDINAMLVVRAKVVSTGKEYQLVLAGRGLSITDTELEKHVKSIQKVKLVHYEKMDLLLERAKRIYTEVGEDLKQHMQNVVMALESVNTNGSIRKANQKLDEIEAILNEIESSLRGSDIFNKLPVYLRLIKGGKEDE
ncbi:MAG: Hsp70 family protein [Defluviitaleaceae bacterium]|nr:Hsp70 family protein [Defluviitaleaceae bacterium]